MTENERPPEHAKHSLETVMAIHARAQQTTKNHRLIERITTEIGQPRAVYGAVVLTVAWLVWNTFASRWGMPRPDPPPFTGLQCVVTVAALVLSTTILTAQNRQARIAESRSHLDLQVSLLIEQKIAKVIALAEELRKDLPMVRDREDPVAEHMKQPVDASNLLQAIEETLERGVDEDDADGDNHVQPRPDDNSS